MSQKKDPEQRRVVLDVPVSQKLDSQTGPVFRASTNPRTTLRFKKEDILKSQENLPLSSRSNSKSDDAEDGKSAKKETNSPDYVAVEDDAIVRANRVGSFVPKKAFSTTTNSTAGSSHVGGRSSAVSTNTDKISRYPK